jgi:hypothetical protein
MTLVETMVALGISGLLFSVVISFTVFTARSFAAIGNYNMINAESRQALDRMTRDIRQTDFLSSYTTNTLVFQTTDPVSGNKFTLRYTYDPTAKTLARTLNGKKTVLLSNCTYYHVDLSQRNPSETSGGDLISLIQTNRPDLVKAVDLSWICSRSILDQTDNTEDVQSARVVIRKK